MKRIILSLMLTIFAVSISAQKVDKEAILVAQYGTSIAETREKTIDLIFDEIKAANPDAEVREAYIAEAVRKKLDKMGVHKDSPIDALLRLHLEGYNKVIVQPTLLLDGTEMEELRKQVSQVEHLFDKVTVGTPLLYTIEDFQRFIPILVSSVPKSKGGVVFVGHGNPYASTGTYTMLGAMLKEAGHDHFFVSTIEGYPTAHSTTIELKKAKEKNVTLVPLLLVCGNHTINDINGDFRNSLQEAGFKTDILFRGIAEVEDIRRLYIEKIALLEMAK